MVKFILLLNSDLFQCIRSYRCLGGIREIQISAYSLIGDHFVVIRLPLRHVGDIAGMHTARDFFDLRIGAGFGSRAVDVVLKGPRRRCPDHFNSSAGRCRSGHRGDLRSRYDAWGQLNKIVDIRAAPWTGTFSISTKIVPSFRKHAAGREVK